MIVRVELLGHFLHFEIGREEETTQAPTPADSQYPMAVYLDRPEDPLGFRLAGEFDRR